MERRLQEVCRDGDLAAFDDLLQEDVLVLNRVAASTSLEDGPLHVAALLGHADLTREIVRLKPELARERNAQGSYPLHLAAANGRQQALKELLKADDSLLLLRDSTGHLPIHTAVLKGRLDIVEALMGINGESMRALTSQGESVLHLGVRSNSFEMVEFLVGSLDPRDRELLNLKDERGNTALHLAIAMKQVLTVRFLANKTCVDMNAANRRGATPLDMLLDLPCEQADVVLVEIIVAAGGRVTNNNTEIMHSRQPAEPGRGSSAPLGEAVSPMNPRRKRSKRSSSQKSDEWINYTPGTLLVVAVLIATVTYQAGIQPPGGFRQDDTHPLFKAGDPLLAGKLMFHLFMFCNMMALFASMGTILLLLCVLPHRRRMLMRVLVCIMWFAVFCTAVAFTFWFHVMYTDIFILVAVFGIAAVWMVARFIIYLRRKLFPKKNPQNAPYDLEMG